MVFKLQCAVANLPCGGLYGIYLQRTAGNKANFLYYLSLDEMFSDSSNEWLNTDVCFSQQLSLSWQSSLTSCQNFCTCCSVQYPFLSGPLVDPDFTSFCGINLIFSPFNVLLRFWVRYKVQNMVFVESFHLQKFEAMSHP